MWSGTAGPMRAYFSPLVSITYGLPPSAAASDPDRTYAPALGVTPTAWRPGETSAGSAAPVGFVARLTAGSAPAPGCSTPHRAPLVTAAGSPEGHSSGWPVSPN